MITIDDGITIRHPLGEVFSFVADVGNLPQWQSEVVTSEVVTEGPARVGTQFTEVVKLGSKQLQTVCEITEFVPNRHIGFTAASPSIAYRGLFSLQQNGAHGTDVKVTATVELKGWYRFLAPLFAGEVRKGARQELEALKRILEG